MIPKEKRDEIKKEAEAALEMIANYPKKFDVTICIWAEGKDKESALSDIADRLSNITYTVSDIQEVEDY